MTKLKGLVDASSDDSVVEFEVEGEDDIKVSNATSSKFTKILALVAVILLIPFLLSVFVFTPAHSEQGDAARLLFLHLPSVFVTYVGFFITFISSIIYLRKKTIFWDLLAGSSAEIGLLFCAIMLVSGSLWGKPTWGTYWQWDPRMTSSAIMFVTYLGYLAVRRMDITPEARSRRAAVLGILSFINVIIVHFSIDWWRGLHQGRTFSSSSISIEGWYLFTLFLGLIFFSVVGLWLLVHRFRVMWLEHQVENLDLERALVARRAEVSEVTEDGGK